VHASGACGAGFVARVTSSLSRASISSMHASTATCVTELSVLLCDRDKNTRSMYCELQIRSNFHKPRERDIAVTTYMMGTRFV
jgi:hypothetical protein